MSMLRLHLFLTKQHNPKDQHIQIQNENAHDKTRLGQHAKNNKYILIPLALCTGPAVSASAGQLKAKHRYYKATRTHRPPTRRFTESSQMENTASERISVHFCSLLAYKYCKWLHFQVWLSLTGYTGLIWTEETSEFLILLGSERCRGTIQSLHSSETKSKISNAFSRQRFHKPQHKIMTTWIMSG